MRRQNRLNDFWSAKLVIEARAQERFENELATYQAILTERAEKERVLGRKLPGRKPSPPVECPRDKDQYNFTDPDSRIITATMMALNSIIMHKLQLIMIAY